MGGTYRSARLPVCRPPTTGRYRQNRPSAIDFDRRRSIEGKEERRKKKKRRRKPPFPELSSPASRCRPCPWAIFLPREETECLPVRGERSRRHR
ncbi:hypothetical protein BHE74_00034274, partial [Ensete ventricosum]